MAETTIEMKIEPDLAYV